MGQYFNPPQTLPQEGRKLEGQTYGELQGQLKPGEKLIGHYDRGFFQNAPYLYSEREFQEFERQVGMGLTRLGFYAVSETVFQNRVR